MRPSLQGILFGSAALVALYVSLTRVPDLVLYNDTPSMPVGFYVRSGSPIELGSIVTVNAHEVAHDYTLTREAGSDFRLLKRVAATFGNIVCADGDRITIDGVESALRSERDSSGRRLPRWSGCVELGEDQVFVLGDNASSFDGRYFGVVRTSNVEGVWTPIFQSE